MAELGASDGGGMMQLRLADVRTRRGDLEGARTLLLRSLAERDQLRARSARCSRWALAGGCTSAIDGRVSSRRGARRLRRCRRPEQGHGRAMALNGAATVEIESGELDAAQRLLIEAYPIALATRDMPIVAMIGVTLASLRRARRTPTARRSSAPPHDCGAPRIGPTPSRATDRRAARAARRRCFASCSLAGAARAGRGGRPSRSRGS